MFFFKRVPAVPRPTPSKIEVFARHCLFSSISQHKKRGAHFSREKCFANFNATLDRNSANLTLVFDTFRKDVQDHFLIGYTKDPIVPMNEGSEAKAFLKLLDYIASQPFDPETIIYIVEDDYLHRPGWVDILKEGFSIPSVDYVTLYDHRDKYFFPMYRKLKSRLWVSQSCHWRTVPSTTNTFAVRFKTLLEDLAIHRRYSQNVSISRDHQKFCRLAWKGRVLISPIPGWSTHVEPEFASPCIDWEQFLY